MNFGCRWSVTTIERALPFGALLYEPSNNIYVLPNDVIYLFTNHRPSLHSELQVSRASSSSRRGASRSQKPLASIKA